MYGEGQGIVTTRDGQEIATRTGQGIGRFSSPGKISFRGSLFFRSNSKDGKLSFLNNLVGVFEYKVDGIGNCSSKYGSGNKKKKGATDPAPFFLKSN